MSKSVVEDLIGIVIGVAMLGAKTVLDLKKDKNTNQSRFNTLGESLADTTKNFEKQKDRMAKELERKKKKY